MGPYPPLIPLAPRTPANQQSASGIGGFYTLRGVIDPMNHRVRSQFVGLVDVWKDFGPWDGALSSPGGGGSMIFSQPAISQWGWAFPHRVGRYRPGVPPFSLPGLLVL